MCTEDCDILNVICVLIVRCKARTEGQAVPLKSRKRNEVDEENTRKYWNTKL